MVGSAGLEAALCGSYCKILQLGFENKEKQSSASPFLLCNRPSVGGLGLTWCVNDHAGIRGCAALFFGVEDSLHVSGWLRSSRSRNVASVQ